MSKSDHPRSRGVYRAELIRIVREAGSSPLARGLRASGPRSRRGRRIIPARAGFTEEALIYDCAAEGSSPLARGLLCFGVALGHFSRIIPARAGFTGVTAWKTYQAVDHPRSRGVYVEGFRGFALSSGSSPLARGLRRAYRARVSLWDHPRSRGVYRRRLRRRPRPEGSSPLARGLQETPVRPGGEPRIIPARAGFT